jgi:DNA mismatch endonuclease (patch repair protein)
MPDMYDPQKRSEIMSKIKGKNTKPELLVFQYLRRRGVYFKKHYKSKTGIVMDLALPRKKRVVFIDGDFWHGRTLDKLFETRSEEDFWVKKIRRNIVRDNEQRQLLDKDGWDVMSVWSSDVMRVRTRTQTMCSIEDFLVR